MNLMSPPHLIMFYSLNTRLNLFIQMNLPSSPPPHNLKGLSAQYQVTFQAKKAMPCILKSLMWSTMIKINIHVFIFEICIFSFVVTLKNWKMRISCFRNEGESVRINYCSSQKNDGVLHIIDQIKISARVPVWIWHVSLF